MSETRKRILLISSNFLPEESGIAVYSSDLAFNLLEENHEVTVLTGLPHYPWWKIPERFAHIAEGTSFSEGLKLVRIRHAIPSGSGAIGRARLEFSFWKNGRNAIKKLGLGNFDLVVAIMPTVASGLLARRTSKKTGIPGIVIFQDIASAGALQSGMPGARFFYKIAKFLEMRASLWAVKVIVVSEAMGEVIFKLTKGAVPVEVIHNYSVLSPSSLKRIEAREHMRLPADEYIILHTGNVGYKQDLLNVVAAADLLKEQSSVRFLIIGHGNQEEVVRKAIGGSKNTELRPFVSSEDYPKILAAADVLLVNERPSLREMSLPSKLTAYLASGRPVIAAVAQHSATKKFLKDAALIVEPGDPRVLADGILRLRGDVALQESLASKAQEFAIQNLDKSVGREKYKRAINSIK